MIADISFIILTFNEEKHIKRCIESILPISNQIYIIDSYSNDNTVEIAKSTGAHVFQNPWVNYSNQFNWAIKNCDIKTEWIMRLDADEYLSEDLCEELINTLPGLDSSINGLSLNYRHYFWGRWIKHGTRYPITQLRIWRNGLGYIENKWMDERVILYSGKIQKLKSDFIHDDLNNLIFFIEKHNSYSTREAIDILNKKYSFFSKDEPNEINKSNNKHFHLWVKDNIYSKPFFVGTRSFIYFFYRYIFKLGFLDGKEGAVYHILQGFWYRFLVDMKIIEIEKISKDYKISITDAIYKYSKIKI